jgi:uncharacterized membrane protein
VVLVEQLVHLLLAAVAPPDLLEVLLAEPEVHQYVVAVQEVGVADLVVAE